MEQNAVINMITTVVTTWLFATDAAVTQFKDECRQSAPPTVVSDAGEVEYEIDNTSVRCHAQISPVILILQMLRLQHPRTTTQLWPLSSSVTAACIPSMTGNL